MKNILNKIISPGRAHAVDFLLFIIVGFSLYGISLKGKFIWDDYYLIEQNTLIQSVQNTCNLFLTPLHYKFPGYYRPLQNATYMWDYHVWGLNAFGYHLTNIGLHIGNSFLLYLVLIYFFKSHISAFLSILIFLSHTILTEPVNYISSRSNLLVATFILASFLLYLKSNRLEKPKAYFVLSLLFFALALLTNEVAVIFPGILLMHNFLLKEPAGKIAAYILLVCGYIVLRMYVLPGPLIMYKFMESSALAKAFMLSLKLMVVPTDLHKNWAIAQIGSLNNLYTFLSGVAFVLVMISLYFLSKKAFFGLSWFSVFLLSAIIFAPIKDCILSEGWFYVSSIGYFILLAYVFSRILTYRQTKAIGFILFFLMFIVYSQLTVARSRIWNNPFKLYKELLSKHSFYSDQVWANIGEIFLEEHKYSNAMFCYDKALQLNPRNIIALNGIGLIYFEKRLFKSALTMFHKTIMVSPCLTEPLFNIATVYFVQNDVPLAKDAYEKVIKCNPSHIPSLYNLVILYAKSHEDGKALAIMDKFPQIRQQFGIK